MSRFGIFTYGLMCYAVFFGVFLYSIGFIGGFFTPTMLDAAPTRPLGEALAIDLGLLALFAVQHSGMARPAFKRALPPSRPPEGQWAGYGRGTRSDCRSQ